MLTAFISYGEPDVTFASRLDERLNSAGIKTFFFPKDAKPGEKLHRVMRDAINSSDKIVFICSKKSLNRPGVINELEETLQREAREGGKQILIPISLDNYVFKYWHPDRTGLKQTILDRVVANFKGAKTDIAIFYSASNRLIEVLGGSIEITYLSWKHRLYLDVSGERCTSFCESEFIPHTPVTEIIYSGMTATGHILAGSTNIGEIKSVSEGGTFTVYTTVNNPLEINKPVKHIFETIFIDSFKQSTEECSFRSKYDLENVVIEIDFPSVRPFKNAYLKCIERKSVKLLNDLILNEDGKKIILHLKHPPIGNEYFISWDW
jgi:hypothetical protein